MNMAQVSNTARLDAIAKLHSPKVAQQALAELNSVYFAINPFCNLDIDRDTTYPVVQVIRINDNALMACCTDVHTARQFINRLAIEAIDASEQWMIIRRAAFSAGFRINETCGNWRGLCQMYGTALYKTPHSHFIFAVIDHILITGKF